MDGTNFDGFVRALATHGTRRAMLRRGAATALAAALAGIGIQRQAVAAACKGSGKNCDRDGECCSDRCRSNGTCAAAGVGDPCNPNKPTDCRSGECGCTKRDTTGKLINCTCRRATCTDVGDTGCSATADCCDGFCLTSQSVCFPPQQQCIPQGGSCSGAPTLCCPGFNCTGDVCTA